MECPRHRFFETCILLNTEELIGKRIRDGHQDPKAALGTHYLKIDTV